MTAASQVYSAGDLGTFRGGSGFPVRYQGRKSGDLPFFKVSDMNSSGNELFMTRANNYISESQRKVLGAVRIPARAIVFAKVGAAVFKERKRILAQDSCIDNNMAAFIVDERQLDVRFAHHLLTAFKLSDLVAVGALPSLNGGQLRSIPMLVPPRLSDQRRIAAALTDADDLIATLERLIAKKQAVKQGMMQQLLTGRTRLPGYTEDWPSVTLGGSGVVAGGGVDKTSNPTEASVLLLNYMDVYRTEFIDHRSVTQVVTAPSPKIAKCSIRAGDVFFTPTSETPDDIARSAVADDDLPGVVYSYHLVRWRPGPGWDRSYLAYAFSNEAFRSQASTLAAGSGTRYVVSMPGFRSLVVPRPPVDEQRAIGEALRDVSSEINVLFRRLAKVRAIKTGMMQQLLTGRTRLHVEAAS